MVNDNDNARSVILIVQAHLHPEDMAELHLGRDGKIFPNKISLI